MDSSLCATTNFLIMWGNLELCQLSLFCELYEVLLLIKG